MARVTKKDIYTLTGIAAKASGLDLTAEWAYGRPRIFYADGGRELSPRLSTGELYHWLHAWLGGYGRGYERGKAYHT